VTTATLTPRQLAGTRLLAALTIQALRAKHQPTSPEDQALATHWLQSSDQGFASLHTACEQLAGTFQRVPALANNPDYPSDASVWRERVSAAAADIDLSRTEVIESRLEQGIQTCTDYVHQLIEERGSPATDSNEPIDVWPRHDGPGL
jgi:hypothetical protein